MEVVKKVDCFVAFILDFDKEKVVTSGEGLTMGEGLTLGEVMTLEEHLTLEEVVLLVVTFKRFRMDSMAYYLLERETETIVCYFIRRFLVFATSMP